MQNLTEIVKSSLHGRLDIALINKITPYVVKGLEEAGAIVPPCKVGQTVYFISKNPINLSVQANTIYEADVVRIVITHLGTSLVIQIHNEYGCTEIPDINKWGEEVFSSREEAEKTLAEEPRERRKQ